MSCDPFLQQKIRELYDTPMQQKIRALRPLPVGVVVWQRVNDTLDDLRREFRTIREHGFTALKQIVLQGDIPITPCEAELAALDEGLIPWHYGNGGWKPITPELCQELGIDPHLSPAEIQNDPRMMAYQTEYLKQRARRNEKKPAPPPGIQMGEPATSGPGIPDDKIDLYVAWLKKAYGTIENLLRVYHLPPHGIEGTASPTTFEEVAERALLSRLPRPMGMRWAGFREKRDILRFLADQHCEGIQAVADMSQAWDADEPIRTGSHHSLSNQAYRGWDFELQARSVAHAGSFYSSFHPTWHLTEVDGEVERPCYMTSRIVADSAKGMWCGMWESVGGPQTYSGSREHAIDGAALERCMLSYLAAGLKGIGLWCWNVRDKGYEIGEYGLCDRTGKPTDRARMAGAISRACQKWRFELWEAYDQPQVGILYSWENDAAFARLSYGGPPIERMTEFEHYPAWARIGAMRALINNCVPFEIVTERNLKDGLAGRYATIYIPHTICLETEIVRILREYVEAGGRVVADTPSLLVQADDGTLYDTRQGSDFERMFGLEIAAVQATFNWPRQFHVQALSRFISEVNITSAEVVDRLDDGYPAVLENRPGKGSATFLTFEASALCHKPGNAAMERVIAETCLHGEPSFYTADRPIPVYRRAAPHADHYFLINDTPERQEVNLTCRVQSYRSGEDCVSGEAIAVWGSTAHIVVEPWRGRWVRLEHM